MSAVRQILDAIQALPRVEQRLILRELVQTVDAANDSEPPVTGQDSVTESSGMLEERGGLLVYTGPVNLAALDHRVVREERIDQLMAGLSGASTSGR